MGYLNNKNLNNKDLLIGKCLINGKWLDADNGKKIEVVNPANNEIILSVPDMGNDETNLAILAAYKAFPKWSSLTAGARSDFLRKWFELIIKNADDLAMIMTKEQGKILAEAKTEIKYAASFVEWYAEEAKRAYGEIIPSHLPNSQILVTKEPVGVMAAITPWNFPAAMITRKIAPALAAGCTCIIKPAIQTPLTAIALGKLAVDAGIPNGVINIVTGDAKIIGQELCSNKLVRKLSFTGSTTIGKLLMQQCAADVKKLSLELGGNAPLIVFSDADIQNAVKGTIASKFRNSGQTCICANRIFVHESIYEEFLQELKLKVSQFTVGDGLDEKVDIGPLISKAAIDKACQLLEDAVNKGAKILCGGKISNIGSNFFEPTIIADCHKDMRVFSEEIFAPIAPIFKFKNDDEAIDMANDTEFGLASYFYTKDLARSHKIASQLQFGMVGINEVAISTAVAPFGGIKESGFGREGSHYGMEEYLQCKYILLKI